MFISSTGPYHAQSASPLHSPDQHKKGGNSAIGDGDFSASYRELLTFNQKPQQRTRSSFDLQLTYFSVPVTTHYRSIKRVGVKKLRKAGKGLENLV